MTSGRHKAEIKRSFQLHLRLTENEFKEIENLAEMLKISKTQTILRAVQLLKQNPKPKRFKNISGKSEKNSKDVIKKD